MNIIVISLERASERRSKMSSQLKDLGIDAVIMDAVDGSKLSENQLDKKIQIGRWRVGDKFMPGEIGCTMSHINALKLAWEKQWPYVIVLEDDITIAEDFKKRINLLFKILPKNWEHVYLSGVPGNSPPPTGLLFPNIIKSDFVQQTHSMMINSLAYTKIIDKLELFETTTDDIYADLVIKGKLNSYTYFPFVTYANSTYSYIWNKSAGHNIKNESKNYFKNKV